MSSATEEKPRRAAVAEDGTLNYTSVSAVKKFDSCGAAWYFRYVLRRKEESGPGALESDACHKRVEHYLKTGENVLGEIERRALRRGLFPEPGKDLWIEDTVVGLAAFGVPFVVKIDCVDPRLVLRNGLLCINDWKFKKDIKKYGLPFLNEEGKRRPAIELVNPEHEDGIQMIGYGETLRRAVIFARQHPESPFGWLRFVKVIRLRHVQVDKTQDAASDPYIDVLIDDFEVLFKAIANKLPAMKATALAKDVIDVPGNKSACWKFGGCAFQKECPHFNSRKPEDRQNRLKEMFNAVQGENKMGMLSQRKAVSAVSQTPAPVVDAVVAKTAEPVKKSLIIDQSTTPDAVLKANPNVGQLVAAILPLDAPTPVKTLPVASAAEPTKIESATPTEALPKRTRRTKAAMEAAKAEQTSTKAEPTVLEAPSKVEVTFTNAPGFSFFVGCHPRSGAIPFSPYVEALEKEALKGFKEHLKGSDGKPLDLYDIRLATGNDAGYGRWKAILGTLAKENPPAPGKYTIMALGIDERIDAVFVGLEAAAADVVTR